MKNRFLILIAFCILTLPSMSQTLEEADKLYSDFRGLALKGEKPEHYDVLYNAYNAYAHVLKGATPQSEEYNRCKEALLDIFPHLADAAYLFTELDNQNQVIKFAQAYVDLSLMYAFVDQNLTSRPEYAQISYFAAYNTCMSGNYQDATDYYRAYLSTTDMELKEMAYQGIIFAYMQQKVYDEALYFASNAVEQYPQNWPIVQAGLKASLETKNDEYLQKFLPLASKLKPGEMGLIEYQAQLYERQGKYAEAYAYYQQLDSYKPNNLEICCHLALNSYNKGVKLMETANLMPNEGDAKIYKDQAESSFRESVHLLKNVLGYYPYAINFANALAMSCSALGDAEGLKEANDNIATLKGKKVKAGAVPEIEKNYNPRPIEDPVVLDDFVSEVDENIPSSSHKNNNIYAIVIGNEKYKHVSEVQYANNDANSFAIYCEKTLGIPKGNVRVCQNATMGEMGEQMNFIKEKAKMNPGRLSFIVYYAGHGLPDVSNNGQAYLLPVDATGTDLQYCYSLKNMIDDLDKLDVVGTTVFLDACFSGATRSGSMISKERSLMYVPEEVEVGGRTIVFSATEGKQTALPYDKEHHGIFTFFLLKNLKESKGEIKFGQLADNLARQVDNVAYDSKNKHQNPKVTAPDIMGDDWREMSLVRM